MPDLGKKYTCYSCHTKFYDLGKPVPLCPKCGADQREADDAPVATTSRSRRVVVEEPAEEPEFAAEPEGESEAGAEAEEEDEIPAREETSDDDDEDEEEEF